MRTLIILSISFVLGLKMAIGTTDLTNQLGDIKSLDEQRIEMVYPLFAQVSKELEGEWNESMAKEFGRVLNLAMEVEKNYFLLDAFYDVLKDKKKRKNLDKVLKEQLSSENFKLYEENAQMMIREVEKGNG